MRNLIGSIAAILTLGLGAGTMGIENSARAEGPGTRIRTTPEIPQVMELSLPPVPSGQARPCEGLRGEPRERCLRQPREADIERRSSGPGATGMGSGAGATSGTNSSAAGGTAPR